VPLGVIVIRDRIYQFMWKPQPMAVEIASNQVYEQYKKFFEEVWEEAK